MTIKELREEKGLSQGKFSESIGIGRTAIVGYEKGKFRPKDEVIAKIKEVYGVDISVPVEKPKPTEEAKPAKRGKKEERPAEQKADGIGAAIKALRKEHGLSQKAFGESIGVKLPTVGAYEGGRIKPSETVMEKIKEVYGPTALEAAAVETLVGEAPGSKKPAKRGKKKATPAAPAAEEKIPAKRGRKKEAVAPAKAAPVLKEKKPRGRKKEAEAEAPKTTVIIQSPLGGSITLEEILEKTGPVDSVYVRVDENKAYWVHGDETGSVELW